MRGSCSRDQKQDGRPDKLRFTRTLRNKQPSAVNGGLVRSADVQREQADTYTRRETHARRDRADWLLEGSPSVPSGVLPLSVPASSAFAPCRL